MNKADIEKIKKLTNLVESITIFYANEKTIEMLVAEIGYKPENIRLNPYIPDGHVTTLN